MKRSLIALATVTGCALCSYSSLGQLALTTPTPTVPPSTESITVLGTELPDVENTATDPTITIGRAQIDNSGARTTADFLRNLTVSGPNGAPTSNNNAGYAPGASSISLRGFDPGLTLVLLDGKRVANYPLALGGTDTFVDLNSIPAAAIAGIDILTDTAAAEFGADAVAGVVNIRLSHDYRGAEADVEYGNTLNKDSSEFSAALLFGLGNENTEVSGALNYYHRDSIANRDRPYSAVTFHPSVATSPLNLIVDRGPVIAAGGDPSPELGDTFVARPPPFTQGDAPASSYTYTASRTRDFNYNAFSDAVPDSQRDGGFANLSHRIFDDQMVLRADIFYQDVQTHYLLAPTAETVFQSPGQTTLAIPPHAPGATLGGPSYADTGVPAGAFNPFNPFQQIISSFSGARLFDFGDRENNARTKAWFSTIELTGNKLFDGSWSYDLSFRDSEIDNTSSGRFVSASRFDRVLNAADPIFDPASKQYIGTTIPYNPFGDFRVPIPTNAPSIAYATIYPMENDSSNLAVADFSMGDSELIKLPAGPVALQFGAQFRRESIEHVPDSFFADDIIGASPSFFIAAHRTAAAAYSELDIPAFSSSYNIPGVRALDFTAAFRFEEFASNLNNAGIPKFGVRWQPFNESLVVRTTWGEGFYEPSLFELYGNPSSGTEDMLFDPVKGTYIFETPTVLRSNPQLQPGDSRNYSAGIIYSPRFLPGLILSADFFNIETSGRVNIPTSQSVIDRAARGQSIPGEEVFRDAGGNIQLVQFGYENGGSQEARGVDFSISYQVNTRYGTFTSLTLASYLSSFRFADLPGDPEQELSNSAPFDSADPYLQWRANSQLQWSWHNFSAVVTCHYLEGFHEILDLTAFSGIPYPDDKDEHWVAGRALFDLQLSYHFAPDNSTSTNLYRASRQLLSNTTFTFGINNLFNEDPPTAYADGANVNYPGYIYDSTGRFIYLSIKKKF